MQFEIIPSTEGRNWEWLKLKRLGMGFIQNKKSVITILNFESDDENYKMYKSATQKKFNSSNVGRLIKKYREQLFDFFVNYWNITNHK